MTYSTSLPPMLTSGPLTKGAGPNIWVYKESATFDTIRAANYITNGLALGMKIGDTLLHWDTTSASAPVLTFGRVTNVTSSGVTIAATGTPIV